MKRVFTKFLTIAIMVVMGSLPGWAQFDATANGFDPESKLITSAMQLSSPASDEAEGTHIEYLIDDNIGTFWHSDWHGKYTGTHYVQVDLNEATTGYYQLVFGRRNSSNTCQPLKMLVEQSTDGNQWQSVKTLDLPWEGDEDKGKYVISDFFRLSEATHLRFTCTQNNSGNTTWHCAELQIYMADKKAALAGAIDDLLMTVTFLSIPRN